MKVKPSKLYSQTNKLFLPIYILYIASTRGQPHWFLFMNRQLCFSLQNIIFSINIFLSAKETQIDYMFCKLLDDRVSNFRNSI